MTTSVPSRSKNAWLELRARGWRSPLARISSGALVALTMTGLAVYALPFSAYAQHAVLVHTALGLLTALPIVVYLVRHIIDYADFPLTEVKLSGYLAGAMTVACGASGVVLTWDGALATRIVPLWRTVHVVTTFGVVLFLGAHLLSLALRAWKTRPARATDDVVEGPDHAWRHAAGGYATLVLVGAAGTMLGTGALALLVRPYAFDDRFPDGYERAPYPGAGPFSPSLAMTDTGGPLDEPSLAGSASCGTAGCHEQIYEEWRPSAHRYAAMDVAFQKIESTMAAQNGPQSTRYCAGCHDPISLFSGQKELGADHLYSESGHDEGISCLACHGIVETDIAGNANYVVRRPDRYLFEHSPSTFGQFLSNFLIRTYPDHHVAELSREMFKAPEFCAACHKQFIDEEVNQVGWVQLQNQFDNWRASRWHDPERAERSVECRECHMPLVASTDPARGDRRDANRSPDDGRHRSHRFLGGNQFIPVAMELEGGEEHARLTDLWLRGEYEIPEIQAKWSEGPAVPIELDVPQAVASGEDLEVRVRIINNKVGHDFPTGPLDIIQAWIELDIHDANGTVVFESGKRDDRDFIEPGTFMFKAEPVDRYGNLIDRHNLWEMVGVRFKRSLFPGSEEIASYAVDCSGARGPEGEAPSDEAHRVPLGAGLVGPLTLRAQLNYRKVDQYLLDHMFGVDAQLTSPVTVLSSTEATVELAPSRPAPDDR